MWKISKILFFNYKADNISEFPAKKIKEIKTIESTLKNLFI
jgi:hypothetical protein